MQRIEKTESFLRAVLKGKHRRGAGKRLRGLILKREQAVGGILRCFGCGQVLSRAEATIEHIIPQSKGGKCVLENLALAHSLCNGLRGDSASPRHIPSNTEDYQYEALRNPQ